MFDALLWNLLLTAALAIVLAALCRLPSMHRRPALRYWLWLLLVVKLITPPLFDVPLLPAVAGNDGVVASVSDLSTIHSQPTFQQPFQTDLTASDMAPAAVDESSGGAVAAIASKERNDGLQMSYLVGLSAVSLLGTCVLLAINAVRAVKLYRWINRAGAENPLLAEACAEVASSLGIREAVRSCAVDTRTTPLLLAWGRPLVVVPRELIEDLSPQQLRGTVAHELAHLLRRDHWANLFVFIVKSLLWWNPVAWWAERELRVAQELCCDAIANDRAGTNRRGYATTLLKALDFVQDEPLVPHALASRMGSRRSLVRRFEMIAETQLSYRLSRWSLLLLLAFAIALTCIPVRAEEEKPAVAVAEAVSDAKSEKATDAQNKKAETAKAKQAKVAEKTETQTIDPEIKKLGEAIHKRITTYSDVKTLTLKDGQTGRMKVKKNVTPVAEILITPHFVENGTKFDLEGFDATGKALEGTKVSTRTIHNGKGLGISLGKNFSVDGEDIISIIMLTSKRSDSDSVAVEVKVLFTQPLTKNEMKAIHLTGGKGGQVRADFQALSSPIMQYKDLMGSYPKNLQDKNFKRLKKTLPKDVYSPTGEDYHYEAQRGRFILSSCGKDGIYGNDDDEMLITESSKGHGFTYSIVSRSGQRHELYPLEEEKTEEEKGVKPQSETTHGKRPQGKCSISGKVVSAETGKPIKNARMYLHYNVTHGSIFIRTADDGTFIFKDIPKGPFSLQLSLSPGYQDVSYNPDGKPGQFPLFLLKDGEQRSGIVLKAKRAYQISGKITDENGKIPENINAMSVLAWVKKDDGKGYKSKRTRVNWLDGSYLLDGLCGKPVYVMAKYWKSEKKGTNNPPTYHPSTFSRSEAKQVAFGEKQRIDNINITLKKEGGLVIEGTVVDEEGTPVPEAFVAVESRDMHAIFITDSTDKQGRYKIKGLGEGEFLVKVDATNRRFAKTRTPVTLDSVNKKIQRDFTLSQGVDISGKFVDEGGSDWQIARSYGYTHTMRPKKTSNIFDSFSLTDLFHKDRPKNVSKGSSDNSLRHGEGDYEYGEMLFPTKSTFVIQGAMPGKIFIGFSPKKEGQKVLKILHDGKDVLKSGIATKPGQEIKDVTIVIGK